MASPKKSKPPFFTGKDTSLAAVTSWVFKVKSYVRAAEEDDKVDIAVSFLSETAEQWFIAKYSSLDTLPSFDDFIKEFKKRFTRADDARQLRITIETITQGTRSVLEYAAEFQTILSQIGEDKVDMVWARRHFERGLHYNIQRDLAAHFDPKDSIDEMATRAQRSYEILGRLKAENPRHSRPTPAPATPTRPQTSAPPSPSPVKSPTKLRKLTDSEREELSAKGACFRCRQPGHIAKDCPKNGSFTPQESPRPKSPVKVEHGGVLVIAADSESEAGSSPYLTAPCMKVPIQYGRAEIAALIDNAATSNVISKKIVNKQRIPMKPSPRRFKLGQAFSHERVLAKEYTESHITIPSKNWRSTKPVPMLVSDSLVNHDAILGMPFLKQEKVLIDSAAHDIVLPKSTSAPETQPKLPKQVSCPSSVRHADITPPKDDQRHISSTWPEISHKVPRALNPLIIQSIPAPAWLPTIDPTDATRYHKEVLAEFPDVFADKLPPRKPTRRGAPVHRIRLKDENKTINGRMFALPEKYLNAMIEFIEEHLLAGRIRPSSSSIAAGTWMIAKNDPAAMPRVVHD